MKRKKTGSLGFLVACTLGAAFLITLLVHGGWVVWIPVLLALAVLLSMGQVPGR